MQFPIIYGVWECSSFLKWEPSPVRLLLKNLSTLTLPYLGQSQQHPFAFQKSFHNQSGSSVKHKLGVHCHLAKSQPAHLDLAVLERKNHPPEKLKTGRVANFHTQPEMEAKILSIMDEMVKNPHFFI